MLWGQTEDLSVNAPGRKFWHNGKRKFYYGISLHSMIFCLAQKWTLTVLEGLRPELEDHFRKRCRKDIYNFVANWTGQSHSAQGSLWAHIHCGAKHCKIYPHISVPCLFIFRLSHRILSWEIRWSLSWTPREVWFSKSWVICLALLWHYHLCRQTLCVPFTVVGWVRP